MKLIQLKHFWFVVLFCVLLGSCKEDEVIPAPTLESLKADIALQWTELTLYTIRFSSFNSPTYASRSLGYMGISMYESVVQGDPSRSSIIRVLNGPAMPTLEPNAEYHWGLILNASQQNLLKLLYPVPQNSHRFIHERIDSLYNAILKTNSAGISQQTINRSISYGTTIANTIFDWSKSDGGYEGYAKNFNPGFSFPSGESYWVPPARGQIVSSYPLHPQWGDNINFVPANKTVPIPAIIPFSKSPDSDYYKQYNAVYLKSKSLTQEEREIAAWWADDPTETFSPPGHSYHIASLAIKESDSNLVAAAEAFARVGIAVADAFINCWRIKYTYFNERPSKYIKNYIDPTWISFWPEPPFPAFPSGHTMHSAAMATVLTDLFGNSLKFTDRSHEGHRRYDDPAFYNLTYPARSFSNFWQAADESAYSRLLGGIHTPQDNDVAKQQGIIVGQNVNALPWKK